MKTRNRHHQLFVPGILFVCFMFAISASAQSSGGNFQVTQTVIANGGNQNGAGNFTLTGTAGQPAAGTTIQQGSLSQTSGFWPGAGALTHSDIMISDVTGTYGGQVTLTAILKVNGVPLSGQSVIFSLNSAGVGTATTDAAGVATLNNVSLNGLNAGSYLSAISAQFAGDLTFAASNVAGQLTVQPATPQLQVMGGSFTYDGQAHGAAVTLNGINNELLGPVVVLYNGSNLLPVNAGSYSVKASFAGNQNYAAVSNDLQSILINTANQTINFAALADKNFGDADFALSGTTSSNLLISFAASGNCALNGSTVHLISAGSCTVTASQSGDSNYNAAASVARIFKIFTAASSTALTSSVNPAQLGESVIFTATVSSPAGIPTGTVQFKDDGTNLGNPVALNASGVATLSTSNLTVGAHSMSVFYSGDINFNSSTGGLSGSQVIGNQLTLAINDVTQVEGNSGTSSFTFTVTLSSGGALPVTVDYATADGSATAGSDYQATSGKLTFAPGDTQKTITVLVNGDTANEPDENFFVNLSNATNAVITRSQGLGVILNDDAPGIRFTASNYIVNENGIDAVLTVVRGGDSSQPATVDYATSDHAGDAPCSLANGFASQRCDYEVTMRTLQFAAGESSKTISIPIIDDAYLEGPETFTVTLSNPAGASLGANSVATVTILDNESVSGAPDPIGDTGFFVRMHYLDFLNREPEPAGFSFWVNNIDSCGADPECRTAKQVDTSAAFFLSIEYQQTGYLVYRTYLAAFGRPPQAPALLDWNQFVSDTQAIGENLVVNQDGWEQLLEQNKQQFMNRFVRRAQFPAALPTTMAPSDFVDKLFANADLAPSAGERQSAINEFGSAPDTSDLSSRARALRRVAENALLCQKEMNRAFVLMQYFGYLRRNPNAAPDTDFSGYDFWLHKLDLFDGNYVNAEMVKSFLVSREYRQRFGRQ